MKGYGRISVQDKWTGEGMDLMQDAWQKYGGIEIMKAVMPVGPIRLRIQNKQTNKQAASQQQVSDGIYSQLSTYTQ